MITLTWSPQTEQSPGGDEPSSERFVQPRTRHNSRLRNDAAAKQEARWGSGAFTSQVQAQTGGRHQVSEAGCTLYCYCEKLVFHSNSYCTIHLQSKGNQCAHTVLSSHPAMTRVLTLYVWIKPVGSRCLDNTQYRSLWKLRGRFFFL